MIRPLTQREWSLLHRLSHSNVYLHLEGKDLQLAQQLSFEELTESHQVNPEAFTLTKQGKESLKLQIEEDNG